MKSKLIALLSLWFECLLYYDLRPCSVIVHPFWSTFFRQCETNVKRNYCNTFDILHIWTINKGVFDSGKTKFHEPVKNSRRFQRKCIHQREYATREACSSNWIIISNNNPGLWYSLSVHRSNWVRILCILSTQIKTISLKKLSKNLMLILVYINLICKVM